MDRYHLLDLQRYRTPALARGLLQCIWDTAARSLPRSGRPNTSANASPMASVYAPKTRMCHDELSQA